MKNLQYFLYLFIFSLCFLQNYCSGRISDQRLCADPDCSVAVSLARAVLRYQSDDERILSFSPGETVTVYSKSAGSRPDLWGAQIGKKRGYVPKNLIQEYRILQKELKHTVPTAPQNKEPYYDVVDGTTLYIPEDSTMQLTTNNVETPKSIDPPAAERNEPPQPTAPETSSHPPVEIAEPSVPPQPDGVSEPVKVPQEIAEPSAVPFETSSHPPVKIAEPSVPPQPDGVSEPVKVPEEIAEPSQPPAKISEPSVPPQLDNSPEPVMIPEVKVPEEIAEPSQPPVKISEPSVPSQPADTPEPVMIPEVPEVKVPEEPSHPPPEPVPDAKVAEYLSEQPGSEKTDSETSVYEYFADTLTGWMSGDGGSAEGEEEDDEDEEEDESEDSQEQHTTNDSVVDSEGVPDKINYLSTNPNVLTKENSGEKNQDDSVTEIVPPAATYYTETVSSEPFTYSWDLPKEVPSSDEISTLTSSEETNTGFLSEAVSPRSEEINAGTFEELTTVPPPSSGIFEELTTVSPSSESVPEEINTIPEGNVEELTTVPPRSSGVFEELTTIAPSSEIVPEEIGAGTFEELTTVSPPISGVFEELTTVSPSSERVPQYINTISEGTVEELTTIAPSSERVPEEIGAGTFEELTTVPPPISETVPEEIGVASFEEITTTASPPISEESESVESGAIFASWVYTLFGYGDTSEPPPPTPTEVPFTTSQTGSEVPVTEVPVTEVPVTEVPVTEESSSIFSWWPSSTQQQTCSDCDLSQEEISVTPPDQQLWTAEPIKMDAVLSSGTFVYLLVTAVTVLIFTLGYYYIEKLKQDGTHVAIINSLQKQLLVFSKEKLILQDELEITKEQVSQATSSSNCSSEELDELKEQLGESERVRLEAEDQVAALEKELESATEAGLELNKMLSEFLSAQKGSEDLSMSVELLQQQLNKQQATISNMNQTLGDKTKQIEELEQELSETRDQLKRLESEGERTAQLLNESQQQKQKLKEDLEESCVTLANQLQEAAQQREAEVRGLREELKSSQLRLSEVEDSLRARSSEVEMLENSLAQLKQLADEETDEGQKKLHALIDVGKAHAELKLVTSERDVLKERLQGEEDARQLLEDHVTVIREQVEKLKERHELAEKEKLEAQTKLEVLSSYFKEKETQLQKELGLQEAMFEQKKDDVCSTHVRIKSLEDEIDSFNCSSENVPPDEESPSAKRATKKPKNSLELKRRRTQQQQHNGSQNEALKQEIVDQERSLKTQITTLEKKAHENWIAARQAERKLDESKQEAGTLRNRLTLLEKGGVAQNGEEGKTAQNSNGELLVPAHSPSPHHFMMLPPPPLPPLEYMHSPPPPLPLYPDRRPPPLGRMSSPPPDPRYSSPYRPPRSPDSPGSSRYRYGSRSPSPPPHTYHDFAPHSARAPWNEPGFRPLNKDTKGLSSGHSSESSRHSKS